MAAQGASLRAMAGALPLPPLALWCPIRQAEGRSPPAMPRPRYRQDPLPIGPDAPQVELFGPEQPNPPC
jgi:hypothetical protein